jgi:HlyD family secretion protein
MKRLQIQFVSRLVMAAAILFSANQIARAQTGGGDFSPLPSGQASHVDGSNAARQPLGGFNAIPFGTRHSQSATKFANQLRTRPQTQLPPKTQVKPDTQVTQPSESETTQNPGAQPKLPEANNSFVARPVSFGKMADPAIARNTPNPLPQDQEKGTGYSQAMKKFIDLNCSVKFIDDIRLPAKETGVIESLSVKEGDLVPAGKIVGKIDDELYQEMYKQAELRYQMALDVAQDETAKQAAEKKWGVASIEAEKAIKLARSGSKSDSERRMAIYTEQLARLEIIKAELEMKKAKGEAELELAKMKEVEIRMRRHILQSEFDAYVIEIFKKPQEFVNVGEEVLRIARMDKLWVQGIVDIQDLNPHEAINRPVTVTVQLARGETTTFEGNIVNVALERQSSQHYMVKAEIKNRPIGGHWVLQPFSEVLMRIHLDRPASNVGAAEVSSAKR